MKMTLFCRSFIRKSYRMKKVLAYLFLCATLLVSCQKEVDISLIEKPASPGTEFVEVSMNLSTEPLSGDSSEGTTKSQMSPSADDAFTGAVLFAFNHSTGSILLDGGSNPCVKVTAEKSFSWSLPRDIAMDIYAIANYDGNIEGIGSLLSNPSLTISDLTSLTFTCTAVSGLSSIPMSGINENVTLNSVNTTISVTVKRLMAKYMFYFNLDEILAAGYTVEATSISACKSNTVVPVFYTGAGVGYAQTNEALLATIDTGTSADLTNLSAGGSSNAVTLYFLENCQGRKDGCSTWSQVDGSGLSGLNLCSYLDVRVSMTKAAVVRNETYKIYLGSNSASGGTACVSNFDVVRNVAKGIRMNLHTPEDLITWRMKSVTLSPSSIGVGGVATATAIKEKYVNGVASGIESPATVSVWVSSDPSVATVSSGTVTGVAEGTCTITATDTSCEEGYQSATSSTFTVSNVVTYRISSIVYNKTTLDYGETATPTVYRQCYVNGVASGDPEVVPNNYFDWSSGTTTVATVNSSGVVTASSTNTGSSVITATLKAGYQGDYEAGYYSGTSTITVAHDAVVNYRITSVVLGSASLYNSGTTTASVYRQKYVDGVATGSPEVVANSYFDWISDATDVATVNASGIVSASASNTGSATITATVKAAYNSEYQASYRSGSASVTVSVAPSYTERLYSIAFSPDPVTAGGTTTMTVYGRRHNGTTWEGDPYVVNKYSASTNNTSIAYFGYGTASGSTTTGTLTITGNNAGSCTISVTATDDSGLSAGYRTGSTTLEVVAGPSISLNPWDFSGDYDDYVGYSNRASQTASYSNTGPEGYFTSYSSNETNCTSSDYSYGNSGATVWIYWNSENTSSSPRSVTIYLRDPDTGAEDYIRCTQAAAPSGPTITYSLVVTGGGSAYVDETIQLTATYYTLTDGVPDSGTDVTSSATWSRISGSSNVSVSSTGLCSASGAGSATIRASYLGKSDTDNVTFNEHTITTEYEYKAVTSVASSSITVGNSTTASAILKSRSRTVTDGTPGSWSAWSGSTDITSSGFTAVSGSSYVGISSSTISGVSEGTAEIQSNYTADYYENAEVTVGPSYYLTISPSSANVDWDDTSYYIFDISTNCTGLTATRYSGSLYCDYGINSGNLRARYTTNNTTGSDRSATIEVSCDQGLKAYATLTQETKPSGVTTYEFYISPSSSSLEWGETESLTAYCQMKVDGLPSGAPTAISSSYVNWSSSNSTIASVNGSGTVTAGSKNGSATITATLKSTAPNYSSYDNTSDTCDITVNTTVTSISISRTGETSGLTNQVAVDLLCSVTLSNGASYNSDTNPFYFEWTSPDEGDTASQTQASEWEITGDCTIECEFNYGGAYGSTSVTYTFNSFTYSLINTSLEINSSNIYFRTYKIVCTIQNDQTLDTYTVNVTTSDVVSNGVTLSPEWESTASGLWGPSSNYIEKGKAIRAYLNGVLVGEVAYN